MKINKIELNNFKRFTHLTVENIPETAKLILLVGPNGSGKSSFFEAMNHFYKYSGYGKVGDYNYLYKSNNEKEYQHNEWIHLAQRTVSIKFHNYNFPNKFGKSNIRGHFLFRSAYRNESDFNISSLNKLPNPTESVRLNTLIENDLTVSKNYQRLIANTISGVYEETNKNRTVQSLKEELVGKIKNSIERVFDDLKLSSLGEPLNNGSFYFSKGTIDNFHYRNLSAGEKAAFDLILDIVVQSKYYPDAIYCIDEPEAHMHTKLQGKVLRELYQLIPQSSQLWISTHSIGMLKEAEEIEKATHGSVVFLDFGDKNFDSDVIIKPSKINKAIENKFYELAFGDFAKLMLPRKIVFCEGDHNGNKRKDYDKSIYTKIFQDNHPDTLFISGGSCSEIENIENKYGEIISIILNESNVIKIVDRDERSDQEVKDLNSKRIKVLSKRHLESYLLDDTLIKKLCDSKDLPNKYEECIQKKQDAINNLISRNKPKDDIKSASGEITNALKNILSLSRCGNSSDAFLRDTMAPLITEETEIYKLLEKEIFD